MIHTGKTMLLHYVILGICFLLLSPFSIHAEDIHLFVGEKTCRKCHHNPETGNQFNIWRLSGHSKAWADLSKNSSALMAKLSGISSDVFETPVCIGCHSTATDRENWERNPEFSFEDGVQCEFCHGPGSEYANYANMSDPILARKAGLKDPDENLCMNCHEHKGSHQARMVDNIVKFKHPVKGKPYFNFEESFKKIAHPILKPLDQKNSKPSQNYPQSSYLGVGTCKKCHSNKNGHYVYSKWRLSAHADAYATLGSKKGFEIAKAKGIKTPPQESKECLACHSEGEHISLYSQGIETFDTAQGVQCESCHGPGVDYATMEVMSNKTLSAKAGLIKPDKQSCKKCHNGYHQETFDFKKAALAINHTKSAPVKKEAQVTSDQVIYKTPFNLAINHDGSKLYAACEASDSLIVVDTVTQKVIKEIKVMDLPHGVCLSDDEKFIYVSNRGSDTISVIDADKFTVIKTILVGDEPHDLITNKEGNILYVANTGSHDISVVDLKLNKEIKRLSGGRGTWGMERTPDGKSIFVTNNLSHLVDFRATSQSEITVIETCSNKVTNRIMVPDANLIQGIDFSPDGEFAVVTLLRTKNLVPIVRVIQGWMITNGFGILWKDGSIDQLLIDRVDDHFADPTDVVITPDGHYAFVTGGGVNEVAVLDLLKIKTLLKETSLEKRTQVLPNHLGVSETYVVKRIEVGNGPRGLVVSENGKFVYVADALDDKISVIDVEKLEKVSVIDLGGPEKITQIRTGERIFHNANITYGRQYTCHSCHPDGGIDGLSYDISADGLGINPVDNRTLKGILDTAPFKWTGKNPSLSRQCGPRLAVFFTRIDPFTPEQARDLESYICTIPRNPNRYLKKGVLNDAQRRGKTIFFRTRNNEGKEIPLKDRCDTCHSGPYFTNRKTAKVGSESYLDTHGKFDVPHLNNIYETAPYLHDGRSNTLEEIWTRFNPEDRHGVTNDMTKDQLNDLIEYLKIL